MFTKHRGTLTLIMVFAISSVAFGGSWWLWSLPIVPQTASRDQLLRAMVTQDLGSQSPNVQQAWVDRLQGELTGDFAVPSSGMDLSPKYRERLSANIQTLQSTWFTLRTAQYATLPTAERQAFLEQQIELVTAWPKLSALVPGEVQTPEAATKQFMTQIEEWISAATGERQAQMIRAVEDGTICWLGCCDLAEQPASVRRQLAIRFARELDRGARPSVNELVTSPQRQETLRQNAELLAEAHVYLLAEQFQKLPTSEHPAFIDKQLADIERWQVVKLLAANPESATTLPMLLFQAQTNRWIADAPPEERGRVVMFVQAVTTRLLWKQLPAWLRK